MATKRPNIVLVIIDNMCPWPLGCYGNTDAFTPNLDRMAAQGIRFNNLFSANALCSPSRASLLTGLMPSAHGIHTPIPDQVGRYPQGWDAIQEFKSLPHVLKNNGYDTALVGKWHLGDYPPKNPQGGFDHWVVMNGGHTTSFWHTEYFENGELHEYDGHCTELWANKAVDYLDTRTPDDNPFFLYVSLNPPYGTSQSLDDEIAHEVKNPFWDHFEHKEFVNIPREPIAKSQLAFGELMGPPAPAHDAPTEEGEVKPRFLRSRHYMEDVRSINNQSRYRSLFSVVSCIDDCVGQITTALQKQGLDQETIVLFTADHGHSFGQHGHWGTGWHSLPANGHRHCWNIPLLMRFPGVIAPGQVSDVMVMQTNLFSTLLDMTGADYTANELSPGHSLAPLLRGERVTDAFDTIFSEIHETRIMRTREWLYVKHFDPRFTSELFHVLRDPDEHHNVIADPRYASVLAEMDAALTEFFAAHSTPQYDVWHGGTMKAATIPALDEEPFKRAYGDAWQPVYPAPAVD